MAELLSGKSIVVIGGTTGLGWSAVQAIVASGASVVALGLYPDNFNPPNSERLVFLQDDAIREGAAEEAVSLAVSRYGKVDGLYHVAGGSGRKFGDGPAHELSLEGWNKTLELNLTSVMLSNRAAIRIFLKQGSGGAVLNLSSVLAFSPSPEHFTTHAYAASKAAVIGFSKSLAATYAKHRIRVNVLAPGLIDTPMANRAKSDQQVMDYIAHKQPLDGGRIGRPGDLDGMVCQLLSDQSAFITGQTIAVDGGWSMA
ncbi:MAG: SDR family oxidoreductase [Bacteroidetes bacterium]|nr:SDR family oxidoreductase [Bacteroidota bacterium]